MKRVLKQFLHLVVVHVGIFLSIDDETGCRIDSICLGLLYLGIVKKFEPLLLVTIGFGGLLSFGHAMFLGAAGYVSAHAAKEWVKSPRV